MHECSMQIFLADLMKKDLYLRNKNGAGGVLFDRSTRFVVNGCSRTWYDKTLMNIEFFCEKM